MEQPTDGLMGTGDTATLCSMLEQALSQHFRAKCTIVTLQRHLSDYASSFAIEELEVRLDDGRTLSLMFKNLSWEALLAEARHVKPAFLYDPQREIDTYRWFLRSSHLGTATYYGAVVDPSNSRYWLFLEKVSEPKLRHVGDFTVWQRTARWLAVMHTHFRRRVDLLQQPQAAHLIRYTGDFYNTWMQRARDFTFQAAPSPNARRGIELLSSRYEKVVGCLTALPVTLIHGDFFAGNVLVEETDTGQRVCPVDWEMAAIGPGLIDLAALTAGIWTEEQKTDLAMAYYEALEPAEGWPPPPEMFLKMLDYCHLHQAVQWLGWALDWSPPPDEARDWLDEALRLAEKIEL